MDFRFLLIARCEVIDKMVGAIVEVQVVEAILIADDRNAGIIQMAVDREI